MNSQDCSVFLIYPLGNSDAIPSVAALMNKLSASEHKILCVLATGDGREILNGHFVHLPFPRRGFISRVAVILLIWFPVLAVLAFRFRPKFVIGPAQWGLLPAAWVGFLVRAKLVYFNLELRFLHEAQGLNRRMFARLEGFLHRACDFAITQDLERAKALANEHNVSVDSIAVLPNSFLRANRERPVFDDVSSAIRGDSASGSTVMYVGSIIPHFLIEEMIDSFLKVSGDTILILHSQDFRKGTPYSQRVRKMSQKSKRVVLSDEYLSHSELIEFIRRADVGLAFFDPRPGNDLNERLMGLSSGKIAGYLKAGVPVVTVDFPSLKWIDDYRCGRRVSSPAEIGSVLPDIFADLTGYRNRAKEAFDQFLALENYLPAVLERFH